MTRDLRVGLVHDGVEPEPPLRERSRFELPTELGVRCPHLRPPIDRRIERFERSAGTLP